MRRADRGHRGERAREDRRDGGVGRDRHEAVAAEGGESERPGGEGIKPGLGRHAREARGRELPRNRDRGQHDAGEEIPRQPSDPIAAQRCEQPGRHSARYLPLPPRLPPAFCPRSAAWYLRRMSAMSTRVGGSLRPISSIVSAMTCDIARLRNHLWFAGMMYQGARFVLVAAMASSYASTYCGHSSRSE